ncbi:putative MATE family efflux protein [Aequitasia blattaphilus]|uniref:Multidrug export protein MepA n=1 Tax=Aequitasia blattaphilus TaxID=2949332 RepID=A0ABT1E7J4_9FIRM|nr:MATE family efflux transporter [Aequitasia blattaphilus]MCP1101800.1 MATE family efflux transporter [Aequitasia blattaphilus]MCR8614440.1 MATE family efflux transporter [Aequitasia blattaphilus]
MKGKNKKIELLGSAPIPKALLAMGIPTMIGMLMNALYNLVDAYFVGGLGESQMGAITVVYPLGQVIVGLGLLFGNGAASYISRLLGQGNKEKANKVVSTALYGSLLVGGIVIVLSVIFLHPILKSLGATESILPYAVIYGGIYIISCIFNVFNVTMNSIVTSEGAAKTTMCALLTGALLNMVLDPVFIYTFDLGIAGAAMATAISQMVSTLVYLIYIFGKKSLFQFKFKDCEFSKENMSEIFKIGIPTLVFQLLTSLSISLINNEAGKYSDGVIAGMGVVTRLLSMGSLTVFGFIKGFQPIAGYSYGAKKMERLKLAIRTSVIWSTVFCVVLGALFILAANPIVSQFTTGNEEMIRIGVKSLKISSLTFMLFGFYTVYSSLFLALGKGKEGFFLGACRQGICFVPIILILPQIWGLNGVLYAQAIADVLSVIVAALMAVSLHKKLNTITCNSSLKSVV